MNSGEMHRVTILAVLPNPSDQASLQEIFSHSNWHLEIVDNYGDAVRALATRVFGAVITEAQIEADRDWKYILDTTQSMIVPVPVIVTDRTADERLWAEVLNLRAYDVLMKPFDRTEVYRIVSSAWFSWRNQLRAAVAGNAPTQPKMLRRQDDKDLPVNYNCTGLARE
jgi:DNA-binding NtrC family response regulator